MKRKKPATPVKGRKARQGKRASRRTSCADPAARAFFAAEGVTAKTLQDHCGMAYLRARDVRNGRLRLRSAEFIRLPDELRDGLTIAWNLNNTNPLVKD